MIPEAAVFEWHFAREVDEMRDASGGSTDIRGAIIGETPGERAWAFWYRTWWTEEGVKSGKLIILRLVVEGRDNKERTNKQIGALLLAAVKEAEKFRLPEVVHWNPREDVIIAAKSYFADENVEVVKQRVGNDDLCCLAWFGPSYDHRFANVTSKDVIWYASESWCWL